MTPAGSWLEALPVLPSSLDTDTPEYKANHDQTMASVKELRRREGVVREGGGAEAWSATARAVS